MTDKKLKLITDGTLSNAKVVDGDGNVIGKVGSVEYIPREYITLVRVGNNNYKPTPQDLEEWRDIFDQIKDDPDAMVFTHDAVHVERIPKDSEAILNWKFKMLLK